MPTGQCSAKCSRRISASTSSETVIAHLPAGAANAQLARRAMPQAAAPAALAGASPSRRVVDAARPQPHLVGEVAAKAVVRVVRRKRNAESLVRPQRQRLQQRRRRPRVPHRSPAAAGWPSAPPRRPASPPPASASTSSSTPPRSSSLCPLPPASGPPEMGAAGSVDTGRFAADASSRLPTSVTLARSRARYARLWSRWSSRPLRLFWCRAFASRFTRVTPFSWHFSPQYSWPRSHGPQT